MKGYINNLEKETEENSDYRRVLYTAQNCQLVVMNLKPGEEIGMEVHELDQFLRFEKGMGKVIINDVPEKVSDGYCAIIPAGAYHNVVNISETDDLKLYTLYSPPEHKDGIVRKTKKEADENEEHFDGMLSE